MLNYQRVDSNLGLKPLKRVMTEIRTIKNRGLAVTICTEFLNIEPRGDETENTSIVQGRHLKIEPTDMGMKPR